MKRKSFFTLACALILNVFFVNAQSSGQHYAGKIIDMHEHIALNDGEQHNMSAERNNTVKDILANISNGHLAKAAIITMAQKGQMDQTRLRNDSVIHLSQLYNSLIPICSVHPMDGAEALAEMERVQKLGVKIIKLHPNSQQFDVSSPDVAAIAKKAGELKMILLFDSYNPVDVNEDGKLIMLAITHPDARFIFAHMGMVNFPQFITLVGLDKYPWYKKNMWFDLSAIAPILGDSPFRDQLVWTIRKIGVQQFLFGSDFPMFDPPSTIKSIYKMKFTKKEEAQIFYTNACNLLQIRP
ncbi:amidohydrolase family protein [Mucilaginibacter sp. OK098]|uniref:amidohydrolase family protein n=1 Tax=Mucilaginibacter sp. OK098 TaxID=1855297 RepID=UPI000913EDA0|nr:amidohydrolase family protein [Mucilaginibacter sp. OK098]SHL90948.1 hypothetical protein SAMN05216524_101147 [Mucilaginibacter sp. OK098]